jgi:hypothetical protein
MAMNPFDILEGLVDPKGAVRSQPFHHYLTGGKDNTDSYLTSATHPALVLVAPKLKHSQLGAGCFRNGLRFHADPPFFSARETCTATALREYAKQIAFTGMTLKKTRLKRWPNEYRSMRCSASLSIVIFPLAFPYAARLSFTPHRRRGRIVRKSRSAG